MLIRNLLIFVLLSLVSTSFCGAMPPQLVLASRPNDGWQNPVFSPDGKHLAFTNASLKEIYVLELNSDSPRVVAKGEKIGRRFAFEPNSQRVAFRLRSDALPGKPERLISSAIYLYDPVHHSSNMEGNIYGPYWLDGRLWYRLSLLGPFIDYDGKILTSGPYWNPENGHLKVLNSSSDTVFTSSLTQKIAGVEISPDGQWVAAVEDSKDGDMLLIRVEDGHVLRIADAFAPYWGGDSRRLICVTRRIEGGNNLSLVSLPSGDTTIILAHPQFTPEMPALSFDGSRAVFVSKGGIYTMELP